MKTRRMVDTRDITVKRIYRANHTADRLVTIFSRVAHSPHDQQEHGAETYEHGQNGQYVGEFGYGHEHRSHGDQHCGGHDGSILRYSCRVDARPRSETRIKQRSPTAV